MATGQPESVVWCHCESCRKHSGAPVSVFVAFKPDAYVVTEGQITKYNSSPGRWRGFCARCGSTLTCESERLSSKTHFHIGHFVMPRNFSRRGTYSRRSACRGYIWATLDPAARPTPRAGKVGRRHLACRRGGGSGSCRLARRQAQARQEGFPVLRVPLVRCIRHDDGVMARRCRTI